MTPQGYQRLDGHRCERLTDNDPAGEHISVEIIGEYAGNKRVRECYVMRWDLLRAKYDIHQVADKLGVTIEQQMEQMEAKNDRDKAAKRRQEDV